MIAIASCTKYKDETKTLLYKSLKELEQTTNTIFLDKTFFITENKTGLSKAYNKFLFDNPIYDIVIFVHDDVSIVDGLILEKIEEAHKSYDIVGIAGGVNPIIREPALWHLMCGGFGPNLRGAAGHYLPDGQSSVTYFGQTPARVALIDGVFMSVNVKRIKEAQWKFNENYDFHHYDLSSSLDANKKKLKLGVTPIDIIHASPGLRSLQDPIFCKNQKIFLDEYKNY